MRIVRASLVHRFHVSDGWTRSEVSRLTNAGSVSYVVPRYYEMEKDDELLKRGDFFSAPFKVSHLYDDCEFLDCDYYAVYSQEVQLIERLINQHEIHYPSFA